MIHDRFCRSYRRDSAPSPQGVGALKAVQRASPGYIQRLSILRQTLDRRRLGIAFQLLGRKGPRVFFAQLLLHTSFRWRLRQAFGDAGAAAMAEAAPESLPPLEPYDEPPWPADRPLVSVVIPCFNYGAFVADAVDSVLAQTFRDLEIIVVEGGSTDAKTRRIVSELRRPRTRVLLRDERHPVGDNRNFGIEHAAGKYICCLDADDMIAPTYVEKAVFLLENYGYDVVSTAVRRFGAVNERYGVLPYPDLSDLLKGNQLATCAVFRRALWERAGGYADAPGGTPFLHEDWRFWIRLACLGARFGNIVGEHLFWYRAHEAASLSNRPGLLPKDRQGELIRQAESARITPEALEQSRKNAARRLRSRCGSRNLLHGPAAPPARATILVMVPYLVLGGAERLLSQVLRRLKDRGYRILVITTVPAAPEQGDTTHWFEPATAEIYHLPLFLEPTRWQDFLYYAIDANEVDVLWIVGSTFAYRCLADLKDRYPGLLVADLLFNLVAHLPDNRANRRHVDRILVENEDVRAALLRQGEQPGRIRLIKSGVDLQGYAPSLRSRRALEELGIDGSRFIAGFSGRLSAEKDPQAVLRIACRFAEEDGVRFVMTGTGPLEEDLRRRIVRLRLEGRVHLVGMVAEVRDYLACYDVLVLPSKVDGRPTVVLEALAMGVPVIASRVGGLPELVQHGETGFLCDPGDAAAFVRYIGELASDPQHHAQMRQAARRFAEAHLGLEPMLTAYAAAFDELLHPHESEAAKRPNTPGEL